MKHPVEGRKGVSKREPEREGIYCEMKEGISSERQYEEK
jgi:hypothetical protein